MDEKEETVLKIEATRSYSTDENGNLIDAQEAARREHEPARREVTLDDVRARVAAGARIKIFACDSEETARFLALGGSPASGQPPAQPAEQRTPVPGNLGEDAYQNYAAATGIRRIEHATVVEADRAYENFAASCGITQRTLLGWSR